jgi:phosphatidylglycerol---prolipoprotein diacylglyceryl transferase
MEFTAEYLLLIVGDQQVQVRYYGIIIVTAMLIAAWMASRLAERTKRDPDHIWGALTWAIFPGIVFARLWFVIFPPISLVAGCAADAVQGPSTTCQDSAWFFANFFNLDNGAIAVWSGGLTIFGAVIGGLLGAWLYFGPLHNRVALFFHYIFLPVAIVFEGAFWIIKTIFQSVTGREVDAFEVPRYEGDFPLSGMSMAPWLDIAAVTLPLAQAIGRWANYVNQELYGLPTSLPWGIEIATNKRVAPYTLAAYGPETRFHPLFLYESLWNLIAFFVLLNLYNRNRDKFSQGDFFLMYLAQYSFIRFLLEFLRIEQAPFFGTAINSSQAITAIVFVGAVLMLFMRRQGGTQGDYDEADAVDDIPEVAAEG